MYYIYAYVVLKVKTCPYVLKHETQVDIPRWRGQGVEYPPAAKSLYHLYGIESILALGFASKDAGVTIATFRCNPPPYHPPADFRN